MLIFMIDNFRQTVVGGISEMIVTTMIKAGIGWLAGLSNPVGAIVKVVLSIYNLIVDPKEEEPETFYLDDTWVDYPLYQVVEDHLESIANDPGVPE